MDFHDLYVKRHDVFSRKVLPFEGHPDTFLDLDRILAEKRKNLTFFGRTEKMFAIKMRTLQT